MNAPRRQAKAGDLALFLCQPGAQGTPVSGRLFNVLSDPFFDEMDGELYNFVDYSDAQYSADFGRAPPYGCEKYAAATRLLHPIDKGDPDAAVDLARYGKIKEVVL